MSYILDALKRADAERSQGAVLQSLGTEPSATFAPSRRAPRYRAWGIGIAVLALVAAAAWLWYGRNTQNSDRPEPMATAPMPDLPPVETSPPTQAPATAAPSAVVNAPAIAQAPANEPDGKKPPAAPVLPILAKAPPTPPPPRNTPAEAKAKASPDEPVDAKKKPANTVVALSPAQRAALPQIAVSGSSYSANAAHRMLIANGQVVKEGQELSPGLLLEAIGPHSAIFNQGGTRFNVNY
ncbi:hypothetical protein LPB72_11045 [Hydrogenophaga crassostreae]|uniref:Type II secretion system protein GspB C-terminal domain-containing protein n=1 Tax=Hydrogenophaga crassostreae TaxID=1763535 RepID=A0A167HWL5_9BURK|nr:general secretion pathway protein GspB [Hydrogenophaga crassostreae]AOW13541.1 hypothetical protein LPB072_12425 [Hydrogenophaga crassostreae]OAD41832.1 hypothetical protein LPB72_11045 [Hydrogenophaga crassostreae]